MIVPDKKDFTDKELYAIDRTIQSGSPVIFLIDGLQISPLEQDLAVPFEEISIITFGINDAMDGMKPSSPAPKILG